MINEKNEKGLKTLPTPLELMIGTKVIKVNIKFITKLQTHH